MKHYFLHTILLFCALILTGCVCHTCPSPACHVDCRDAQSSLINETWLRDVPLDPHVWTRGADRWFLYGDPNDAELYNQNAPSHDATTFMNVKVPDFTHIQICGDFQVQIVGEQEQNSVYVLGPNDSARLVSVSVYGSTLYVRQAPKCDPKVCKIMMNKVIVRIGIHKIRSLIVAGCSNVYGRNITSNSLAINSTNGGNIMLSGHMNLTDVKQYGSGTITLIGALSRSLNITDSGSGNVYVSGCVNIHSIVHCGCGTVSIIGSNSNDLTIYTAGSGLTTIAGYSNLKKATALNCSRVYVYWVNSDTTDLCEHDNAVIGLAGNTRNLNIDIQDGSRFYGQYLHAENGFIRTKGEAHANVQVALKLFAYAGDNSSIYIFGSPRFVSKFPSQNSMIIPVQNTEAMASPPQPLPWNDPGDYK